MRAKLAEKLKNSWKQAIRSGRIVELADEKPSREFTNLDYYITCDFTEENWENFVVEDSAFRKQLASKKVEYNRFKCKGDYTLWLKVIQLISSIFMHRDGSFKDQNQSRSGPTPWKDSLVKFCNRVLYSLPRQQNYRYASNLDRLKKQLSYVRTVIQPLFSSKIPRPDNNNIVEKDKLIKLWFENRTKCIEIIKNDGNWPETIYAIIDKERHEEFYGQKYATPRSDLIGIVNEFEDPGDEIPDFDPDEVGGIIKTLPPGKKWGIDGVTYEDYKKNVDTTKVILSSGYNVCKRF